jgi:hypothetical protein
VCRLCQGQVVDIETLDPRGQNLKQRPVVVVAVNEALDEFVFIAVSTNLSDPLPDDCILLPWSPDGRARTGLVERCAAKTNWVGTARRSDVVRMRGHVPGKVMVDIMRALPRT